MKSPRLPIFSPLYLAIVAILAIGIWLQPTYDWDQIGYAGVVNSLNHSPPDAHRLTFDQLRRELPPSDYDQLTRGAAIYPEHVNRYRATIARDPISFNQQLPFYRFRVTYTLLLYLFQNLGLPIVRAQRLVGVLAFVMYSLIVYRWLAPHFPRRAIMAIVWAIATCFVSDSISVARTLTPDMLATSILLAAYYLLLERRAIVPGLFLLFVAIATRTDYVLYAIMALLITLRFESKTRARNLCIAGVVGALALYAFLNLVFDHYPWSTLIWHTFYEPLPRPADTPIALSVARYAHLLAHGFDVLGLIRLLALITCTLATLLPPKTPAHKTSTISSNRYRAIAVIMLVGIAIHYLLFPGFWTRFFVANFTVTLICLAITRFTSSTRQSSQTPSQATPAPAPSH